MLAGVGTITRLNQENQHVAQEQMKEPPEPSVDVVEGKVNRIESINNACNESDLNEESHTEATLHRRSREGSMIDVIV